MFFISFLKSESVVLMVFVLNLKFCGLSTAEAIKVSSTSTLSALEKNITSFSSNVGALDQEIGSSPSTGPQKDSFKPDDLKNSSQSNADTLKTSPRSNTGSLNYTLFKINTQSINDLYKPGDLKDLFQVNSSFSKSNTGFLNSTLSKYNTVSRKDFIKFNTGFLTDIKSKPSTSDVGSIESSVESSVPNVRPECKTVQCPALLHNCGTYTEELGEAEHRISAENIAKTQPDAPRCRRSLDSSRDNPRMRISNKIMRLNRIIDEARRQEKNNVDDESNLIPVRMKDVNRLTLSHVRTKNRNKYKDHGEYKIKDIVSETLSPDINIDALKGDITNLKEETIISESDSKGSTGEKKEAMKKRKLTTCKQSPIETAKYEKKSKDGKKKKKSIEHIQSKMFDKHKEHKLSKGEQSVKELTKDEKKSKEHKHSKVHDKHKFVRLVHLKPKDAKEIVSLKVNTEIINDKGESQEVESVDEKSLDDVENINSVETNGERSDFSNDIDLEENSNDNMGDVNMINNKETVQVNPSDTFKGTSLDETDEETQEGEENNIAIKESNADIHNDRVYDRAYENGNILGSNQDETALTENEPTENEPKKSQPTGNSLHVKSLSNMIKMCGCKSCPSKCAPPCPATCTTPCTTKCTVPCTTKCTTTCKCTTSKCPTNKCCPARVYICANLPKKTTSLVHSGLDSSYAKLSDGDENDTEKRAEVKEPREGVELSKNQESTQVEDLQVSKDKSLSLAKPAQEQDSSVLQLSQEMHGINNRLERIIQIIRSQKKAHVEENNEQQVQTEDKMDPINEGNISVETDRDVQKAEAGDGEPDKPSAIADEFQKNPECDHQKIVEHKKDGKKVTHIPVENAKDLKM